MRLIKKINNNFVIAVDANGKEVIASGRGIGFMKMPMTLNDTRAITRIYYDISSKYISFLSEIPEDVINVSEKIVEVAKKIVGKELNPNFLFTLADHTDFCIKRTQQGIALDFSMTLDFKHTYRKELEVGYYALQVIQEDMGIELPEKEAYGFAINLISSEIGASQNEDKVEANQLIDEVVQIIEWYLDFTIHRDTDNFERFELHLRYLFANAERESLNINSTEAIFNQMRTDYPSIYECVLKIKGMLLNNKNWEINDDELLYMMLHINRLYVRQTIGGTKRQL